MNIVTQKRKGVGDAHVYVKGSTKNRDQKQSRNTLGHQTLFRECGQTVYTTTTGRKLKGDSSFFFCKKREL